MVVSIPSVRGWAVDILNISRANVLYGKYEIVF